MKELNHLNALRQGAISTQTINDFLAENGPKPATIYEHGTTHKLYDTVIDWQTLAAVKGIVWGIYLEMRGQGVQAIANEILLEEGMPQRITGRQRRYLNRIDQQFDFTPSLTPEIEANLIVIPQ